jgi:bacillithiol biosynthesis deacetylase BshB1
VPRSDRDGLDLVAFAPHPDDVELFCGGTMLVAAEQGLTTAVVDLSDGELATNGDRELRAQERDAASTLMGLTTRRSLSLPDGSLGSDESHRHAVVQVLRELRPHVVLAPYGDDRHPDHAAAARLVHDACFLTGLRRYGEGQPHRPARVYRYMLHTPFEPAVVVDVGAVWQARCQLLRVYRSQVSRGPGDEPTALNDGSFLSLLEARSVHYGAMVGVAHGEPLATDGPLLLSGLAG